MSASQQQLLRKHQVNILRNSQDQGRESELTAKAAVLEAPTPEAVGATATTKNSTVPERTPARLERLGWTTESCTTVASILGVVVKVVVVVRSHPVDRPYDYGLKLMMRNMDLQTVVSDTLFASTGAEVCIL